MSGKTVVWIDCDCLEIYAQFDPKPGNPEHKGLGAKSPVQDGDSLEKGLI